MRTIARLVLALLVMALLPLHAAVAAAPGPSASASRLLTDTDGDGLDDTRDGCPAAAAATSTGCPLVSRSVSLKWLAGKQRLQVQVTSPVAACAQRARVAVFRVRSHKDYKVFGGSTSFSGRLKVAVARGATYYVTVPTSYASLMRDLADLSDRVADELVANRMAVAVIDDLISLGRATAQVEHSDDLSAEVILAQVRSIIADLLALCGMDPLEATDVIPLR